MLATEAAALGAAEQKPDAPGTLRDRL